MVKIGVIFMSFSNPTGHFTGTLHKVHTVHTVKSAVSLKWPVGFKNDMNITPIFTIIFSSKMLIEQCFTSLEHTFLDDFVSRFTDL